MILDYQNVIRGVIPIWQIYDFFPVFEMKKSENEFANIYCGISVDISKIFICEFYYDY